MRELKHKLTERMIYVLCDRKFATVTPYKNLNYKITVLPFNNLGKCPDVYRGGGAGKSIEENLLAITSEETPERLASKETTIKCTSQNIVLYISIN